MKFRKLESMKFLYEINTQGQLRNIKSKRILNPMKDRDGYLVYKTKINNINITVFQHKLLAEAFIRNPNPEKYNKINHKNEIKDDNRLENLEWCNTSYNNSYGLRLEKCKKTMNEKYGNVLMISENKEFNSCKEAAEYIVKKLNKNNIDTVRKNINKVMKHGGFVYGSKWKRLDL